MFEFNNKSNLILILVLIAVMMFFSGRFDLTQTLLSLPALIIALSFHEFAHAWMAVKLGDPTPKKQGRLNVNPISHMDPLGTICLLFGGFGWGKPVQINPTNFKNPEKDSAKVALAGPMMNFILMLIFAVILGVFRFALIKTGNGELKNDGFYMIDGPLFYVHIMIYYAIYLNLGLGLFNLLPVPPLDGSKIYRAILKGKAKQFLYDLEKYSMILIMILFFVMNRFNLLSPIVEFISKHLIDPIVDAITKIA